jgi:hypothetical protein
MKRANLFFALLIFCVTPLLSSAQQISKIYQNNGASVQVNFDGSVTVTTAGGKTFQMKCQPALPSGGANGQVFCKSGASAGVYFWNVDTNDWSKLGTGGGATDLDGLTDVTITSPANDDIVQRKGGVFVNRTLSQLKSDLGWGTAAALNVPASGDAAAGEVVKGNDSRLTNARTPTTHTHTIADITSFSLSSPALAQFLRYDGTQWVNSPLANGDLPSAISGKTIDDTNDIRWPGVTTLPSVPCAPGRMVRISNSGDANYQRKFTCNEAGTGWDEHLTPNAQTVIITGTAGTGGVTAGNQVKYDTDGTVIKITGTEGILGTAKATATAGNPVQVTLFGPTNAVAEGAITAGHYLQAGTTTPTSCKDTGQTARASIPLTTNLCGKAATSATNGQTFTMDLIGPYSSGTQSSGTTYTGADDIDVTGTVIRRATTATGDYFLTPSISNITTTTTGAIVSANQMRCLRIQVTKRIPINTINFEITTGAASSHASLSLYSADGNTLLGGTGAVSSVSTGIFSLAPSAALTVSPGPAQFCWTADSVAVAFRTASVDANALPILNSGRVQYGTAANASSAGVPPATLGTITADNTNNTRMVWSKWEN